MSNVKLVNTFKPPVKPIKTTEELLNPPSGEYDINFVFPVKPLETDRVKLVPFYPPVHMKLLQQRTQPHPELFRYWSFGPFPTLENGLHVYENSIRSDASVTWFAVLDKTRPDPQTELGLEGRFAGVISILSASPGQSQAEIGYVLYLPEFQRTHVGTHASGLLLHYLLDSPSAGGLGLRRVQWKANERNERSVAAGKRLGFKFEGVLRWHVVLPEGKEGLEPRKDGNGTTGKGRHTAMLSLCWDDWEAGGRERIDEMMRR